MLTSSSYNHQIVRSSSAPHQSCTYVRCKNTCLYPDEKIVHQIAGNKFGAVYCFIVPNTKRKLVMFSEKVVLLWKIWIISRLNTAWNRRSTYFRLLKLTG